MKQDIHPDYVKATVRCSCGNTFETRATEAGDPHRDLLDCHPFYTGKQKLVDTGGRVERFRRRYAPGLELPPSRRVLTDERDSSWLVRRCAPPRSRAYG